MALDDAPPTDPIQIGFQVLHFGQQVKFQEDDIPVIADEGDVLAIFPHPGKETCSLLILTPEQALDTAEALARAAKMGMDAVRKYMKESQ